MPEDNNGGRSWAKKNVKTLVTWALILVMGGVAWGQQRIELETTQDDLKELKVDSKDWTKERTQMASDLRVTAAKVDALDKRFGKILEVVDRVEHTVTRLEAVARHLHKDR